jgi:hypothetical protein
MTEKSGTRGKPALEQGQRRRTDNGLPASSQVPVRDSAAAAREIERFRFHGVVFCAGSCVNKIYCFKKNDHDFKRVWRLKNARTYRKQFGSRRVRYKIASFMKRPLD